MKRRDFLRSSAVGAASVAAAGSLPVAYADTPGPAAHLLANNVSPDVGAGSTAPIRPFALRQVAVGPGLFQEKRDLMKNFIERYDHQRFLLLFNNTSGRPNPPGLDVPGGWEDGGLLSGHWTGHYLTALAQSHVDQDEQVFKDKLDWMVAELGECQDALLGRTVHPGYLGALPEDVVLRAGPPRFALYGDDLDTNTWAPWYTQHKIMRGLLDAYTLTGSQRAFEIVRKMADWAHLALTLGDIHHPDYSGPVTRDDLNLMWDTYIAGEYGGANEVFAEIYGLTGDDRHLQTARCFDNRESLFGACVDNRDILVTTDATRPGRRRPNRLHANTHVPNFVGYLRIFEQTGEEEYRVAAKNFFGMVVPHRMFAHGGTSGNFPGSNDNPEMFQNRDNVANAIGSDGAESCTTYNLLKLARNLFFFDPDPAYLDYYERGLVNMIAGQRADTDTVEDPQLVYFQPLTPGSRRDYGNTGTCCGGTGLENHTKYQETIYFRSADGSTLWVNLYATSRLAWTDRGFTITQRTDFPREQGTTLTVDGSGPLDIKLRVPGWVAATPQGFVVSVNGQRVAGPPARPGSYLTLSRTWSPGDTIEVAMPFTIRIERAIDRPDTQSIFWGPLLMPILGDPGAGNFRELTLYRYLKLDGEYSRAAITPSGDQTFTTGGLTLRPHYVGDAQPQSPYFRRVEPDVVFGTINTGVPNRKRDDDLPNYDVPVEGIGSPGDEGLTFLDVVWDAAPFPTHGDFVRRVVELANEWVVNGLFTAAERDTVIEYATQAEGELRP
ncbi:glycoside hydrolase family 127 protein [Saccharopolyspora sp. K220]|uniref:glycoside hydrolase family 127 protein n=1 Tax=Saccharopolyspora soli TaxID=2926618 RepID=UPI001F57C6D3|nr:beta-L-arabinofuranosidase domain-containing protein [Saccharopolyspora soli]MCI2422221.1 glycoside hydrolase family 127 protein [Saccharopolyspora soli]